VVEAIVAVMLSGTLVGCGTSSGNGTPPSLAVVRAAGRDLPSVTFNSCVIPPGQATWANILLTGGKGAFKAPYRAVWSLDGTVDSRDPQREIAAPGNGARLGLRVTLGHIGQTFLIQVSNAHGSVGSFSFTNTAANEPQCNKDGRPPAQVS
jgi:hypothetical protein